MNTSQPHTNTDAPMAGSMSAARWSRVQDVFSAAIDCAVSEREPLLMRACGGDAALRREVELLIASHERAGVLDGLAECLSAPSRWRAHLDAMEWSGRRVAQYQILTPLGAGSMGWVFKAHDERLGRPVALKFLSPHLSTRAEAKQRFLQEARAAAALDHPNICTIHEIGETADGHMYIAMPLYQGGTLETRLEQGALCSTEVIGIAQQVASGLAKAHEHGIVHRDVKPSNIALLPDGAVKILDFGVALIENELDVGSDTVAGTLAYMSPEQTRGEPSDHQSDIWALGVVLYEMATGSRPFQGESVRALKSAVQASEPPSARSRRADLPIEIDEIIAKALAKSPSRRYASVADMAAELAELAERDRYVTSAVSSPLQSSPAPTSTGERRRAAVLMSIVADYPALIEQLAPETLESLMVRVHNVAVEVVRGHGGLVNHAFGEEIMSVFGVPAGHEDDELRAVRAAMELHERVRQIAQTSEGHHATSLRLQSGVHSDSLVAQRLNAGPHRYRLTGRAVQVAQRLAMLAPSNTVFMSPACHALVTPYLKSEPQSPVVLSSERGAVTPFRVLGESGLRTRLEAAVHRGLTTYAGRAREMATLMDLFAQAREGHGQIALIVGEAGVGKSRLLYEWSERISTNQICLLEARCPSYGGVAPYQPFVDILRQGLQLRSLDARALDDTDVVARVRSVSPTLDQFLPLYLHLLSIPSERYPLPRDLRGEHFRQAMPEALAALMTRLARDAGVVLLLEDWHWSDDGSREALNRLIEIVPAHAIFVVVTTRREHIDQVDWSGNACRMQLVPLDYEASVAIILDVLHVDRVVPEFARLLFERTGGNPFFLEEICHTLLEQGALGILGGEGVVTGGVEALRLPDTVQAVIRTRLDGLGRDSLEVLRIASVIGREFAHSLLADVGGDRLEVESALARLMAAGLIQQVNTAPQQTYRFKHALTHEVTYESLLGHQRRSWHRIVGTAIETAAPQRVDEQAELLAHHFTQAEAWVSAVRYGRRAADRARALSQYADALAMLDRVQKALVHLSDDDERMELAADILLQQERLCETLGQRGRQQEIVGELIALLAPRGASSQLAQAYQRQGDLLTLLKRFDAADRALTTALRVSREHGDAVLERHALRSIGLLRWHEERHADALSMTERALAIDRARCDDLAVAGDLANLGAIYKSMGRYERALACFEEALAIPALAQNPSALVYSLQSVCNVYRMLGDLDSALKHIQRANEISRDHLLPIQRSFHLTAIAHIQLQQGRVGESLQTYREAVELSRRARHADGLVQSLRTLGEVLLGLGQEQEALPYLREAAALFAQLEDTAGQMEMWSRVANVLERQFLPAQAAEAWEKARALCVLRGDARFELDALEGIARAARELSVPAEEAIAKLTAALALATTLGAKRRELALRNSLGILEWERGAYMAALRHYEIALGLARESDERTYEVLILNSLGVTLSRLDRLEEARTALEESIALSRQSGAQLLEAHALAALGEVDLARKRFDSARAYFTQSLALRATLSDDTGQAHMQQRLAALLEQQQKE